MGVNELAEWAAFYEMEPFGPRRDNLHAGMIAAEIVNSNGGRRGQAVSPVDYLIEEPEQAQARRTQNAIQSLMKLATPRPNNG